MNRLHFSSGLLTAGLLLLIASAYPAQQPGQKNDPPPAGLGGAAQNQQNNANPAPAGKAEAFTSREGKKGWRVVIPGGKPLATPAYADGKIFLGGGFGSHEFYALDAKTGKQQWVYRTGDDGPTAAVISGDLIAFNTESCELEI